MVIKITELWYLWGLPESHQHLDACAYWVNAGRRKESPHDLSDLKIAIVIGKQHCSTMQRYDHNFHAFFLVKVI